MRIELAPISRIASREGGHVVRFGVKLVLEEERQVAVDDIAEDDIRRGRAAGVFGRGRSPTGGGVALADIR